MRYLQFKQHYFVVGRRVLSRNLRIIGGGNLALFNSMEQASGYVTTWATERRQLAVHMGIGTVKVGSDVIFDLEPEAKSGSRVRTVQLILPDNTREEIFIERWQIWEGTTA